MLKAFILDPLWPSLAGPEILGKLKGAGIEVVVDTEPKAIPTVKGLLEGIEPRLLCLNPDYPDWSLRVEDYRDIPNLVAILPASTSFGWIDASLADSKNIPICNIRNFSTESVAEWAMTMTFALARRLPLMIKQGFELDYSRCQGRELKGATAGVIGLGHIGKAVAERCSGLGMKVIYWSRATRDARWSYAELAEIFRGSDYIYPALPDNAEVKALFSDKLLASLKPGATFVSLVHHYYNHALLLEMVKDGRLSGYGFENSKAGDFASFEGNVWAAPAYAWCTSETFGRSMEHWVENMLAAAAGKFPNRVN